MSRRLLAAATGLLAGLLATAAMVLAFALLRVWVGVSPPPEALPDRFAPTLDINTFFSLFGRFGGYNGLKRFGITSGLTGLIVVGAVVGIAFGLFATSDFARRRGYWRGWHTANLVALGGLALAMWVGMMVVLWPVLGTNFLGLPPTPATVVSMMSYLLAFLLYAVVLLVSQRWLMPEAALAPVMAATAAPIAMPLPASGGAGTREDLPAAAMPTAADPAAPSAPASATPAADGAPGVVIGRRAVVAGAATAALVVPSVAIIRQLNGDATFSYDGTPYSGPGVQPIAPNDKFYTVTKNVVDPNIIPGRWGLQVDGLVDRPHTYSFDEITPLATTEQETTLMCISNQIGAGLFSNAVWTGVPMRDLLETAGVGASAVEVRLHAADGYTDTFSIEKALTPTTMVAVLMNGEPLPRRHGYPVRIIAPGMFGEKNVKWVTRIEVVDYDAKGFYEQQGWGPNFEVPTRSDIFAPRWARRRGDAFNDPFPVNRATTIRGRAFAGVRGVQSVEFSADDGATWTPATIDYPGTDITWSVWSFAWRPTEAGEYTLVSRAVDGTGTPQIEERRGIAPEGATGYHRVVATVG